MKEKYVYYQVVRTKTNNRIKIRKENQITKN